MAFNAPLPPSPHLWSMPLGSFHMVCGQCLWAVFIWCVYCEGCIHYLEGEECLARNLKERDESRWVLHKWEEEVQVGKLLLPTPSVVASHAKATTSSPCALSPTLPPPDGESTLPVITPPNPSPTSLFAALELLDGHPSALT